MDQAANLMLLTGALLAAGVLSSRLSTRSGVPLIVLFVAVGLLAGEEGPLGIPLNDVQLTSEISVGLLALILFDGGLSTPLRHVRRVAAPSVLLASLGVVLSAAIIGAASVLIFKTSWEEGLLLGAVLGSTDAAAVFSAFRGRGVTLPGKLQSTLEVESGLNDPVAIFLVVTLTDMLHGAAAPPWYSILISFVLEMALGIAIGAGLGWLASRILRKLHLDVAGLYLVFSLATALLAFGAAQRLGGSGFIAVYAAGVLMGEARLPIERGIRRFHDGVAWIAQVGVFVLLGLLAFPSHLVAVAPGGLAIALALVFIARPLSVWLVTLPFRYDWRDRLIIACGGLRGAVPVILATIPLAASLPGAGRMFNVTFFAVLASVLVQGTLLPRLAKRLGKLELEGSDAVALELTALRETGQELLGYRVEPGSAASARAIRRLALPKDSLIVLVVRGGQVIPPRGSTILSEGDQVYVLNQVDQRPVVAELFLAGQPDEASLAETGEFALDARLATLGDVTDFYGVDLPGPRDEPLNQWLEQRLKRRAIPGDRIRVDHEAPIDLVVVSVRSGLPHIVAIEVGKSPSPPGDRKTVARRAHG